MRKLCFAMIAAAAPAFADVEPGNWELTVTTTVDGMPGPMAPVTRSRCISPAEAKDPSQLLGGAECEFSNRRDSGSEITFNAASRGRPPLRRPGPVAYRPPGNSGTP